MTIELNYRTYTCHQFWVVVSKIFYFHPYLGKIPNLTNLFQMGWNHQLELNYRTYTCNQLNVFSTVFFPYEFWSSKNRSATQWLRRVKHIIGLSLETDDVWIRPEKYPPLRNHHFGKLFFWWIWRIHYSDIILSIILIYSAPRHSGKQRFENWNSPGGQFLS